MASQKFEEISKEIDIAIAKTKALDDINEKLIQAIELQRQLSEELHTAQGTFIPIMKNYLVAIIDVRMAFGREVVDILKSTRELNGITKGVTELSGYVTQVSKLIELLNNPKFNEFIEKMAPEPKVIIKEVYPHDPNHSMGQ